MYNKIFTKILDSSVWLEPTPTRIVWITLLAAMDEDGFCSFAAVGNVAGRARVTIDEAKAALDILAAPDPESSDPENEGRRIERVSGGWIVLNAIKYKDIVTRANAQDKTRERVRRFREKNKIGNADVTPRNDDVRQSVSDTEANTEKEQKPPAKKNTSQGRNMLDPRHHQFADLLERYWKHVNPDGPEMPWGKRDITQLKSLLSACPEMTTEQFHILLRNRARSDVAHGQRVCFWLSNVTKYTQPLDRFGNPIKPGGNNAAVSSGKTEGNMAVLAESLGPRQCENSLDEDGLLPAGEDRQADTRTIQPLPNPFGPESVSGSHGDTSGESSRRGSNGVPFIG